MPSIYRERSWMDNPVVEIGLWIAALAAYLGLIRLIAIRSRKTVAKNDERLRLAFAKTLQGDETITKTGASPEAISGKLIVALQEYRWNRTPKVVRWITGFQKPASTDLGKAAS